MYYNTTVIDQEIDEDLRLGRPVTTTKKTSIKTLQPYMMMRTILYIMLLSIPPPRRNNIRAVRWES